MTVGFDDRDLDDLDSIVGKVGEGFRMNIDDAISELNHPVEGYTLDQAKKVHIQMLTVCSRLADRLYDEPNTNKQLLRQIGDVSGLAENVFEDWMAWAAEIKQIRSRLRAIQNKHNRAVVRLTDTLADIRDQSDMALGD